MKKINVLLTLLLTITLFTACTKQTSTTEQNQTLVDSTAQTNEEPIQSTTSDSLDGFGVGEFVATQLSEDSWYLGKITGFENGQVSLLFVDNDTATKPSSDLIKLDGTQQVAVGEKVYALFGDGVRFREATVKNITQDSLLVSFEGYDDDNVHVARVFKK